MSVVITKISLKKHVPHKMTAKIENFQFHTKWRQLLDWFTIKHLAKSDINTISAKFVVLYTNLTKDKSHIYDSWHQTDVSDDSFLKDWVIVAGFRQHWVHLLWYLVMEPLDSNQHDSLK